MSKYSRELKLIIAKQCLDGKASYELSKEFSISASQIRYWTQVFSIHGTKAFMATSHGANAMTKLQALNLMWSNDWSLTHTSAVLNLSSPGSLSVWLKKYAKQDSEGLNLHQKATLL